MVWRIISALTGLCSMAAYVILVSLARNGYITTFFALSIYILVCISTPLCGGLYLKFCGRSRWENVASSINIIWALILALISFAQFCLFPHQH